MDVQVEGECKMNKTKHLAKPIVKWAGGKRSLLDTFETYFPTSKRINKYVEPFLGGGSVLFHFLNENRFDQYIVSDINPSLITMYVVVQRDIETLIEQLSALESTYLAHDEAGRKAMFYELREKFNELRQDPTIYVTSKDVVHSSSTYLAALFIYLNRTCFNGLYRENLSGGFNVPHGRYKKPLILNKENLLNCHEAFQKVEFVSGDFEELTSHIDSRTFIYLDPPYRPLEASNKTFNGYSKESFDDEEQRRLARWCRTIDEQGGYFMLSNSNPKNINPEDTFFEDLYQGFYINDMIVAPRIISAKASTRKPVTELLVWNYRQQ